jgi:hypothetical protein
MGLDKISKLLMWVELVATPIVIVISYAIFAPIVKSQGLILLLEILLLLWYGVTTLQHGTINGFMAKTEVVSSNLVTANSTEAQPIGFIKGGR